MRIATTAVVLAVLAAPALADPRILTVQDQAQTPPANAEAAQPAQPQAVAPGASAQDRSATPGAEQVRPQVQPESTGTLQAQPQPQPGVRREGRDQFQRDNLPPAAVAGRYRFRRVDGGFVRVDAETGQVAFCSPQTANWMCQAVPENKAALEKEITRLKDEVARLRQELVALRAAPPPQPPADEVPPAAEPRGMKLPTEDMARARAALESAWHRLVDMIVNFQRDMMHKG